MSSASGGLLIVCTPGLRWLPRAHSYLELGRVQVGKHAVPGGAFLSLALSSALREQRRQLHDVVLALRPGFVVVVGLSARCVPDDQAYTVVVGERVEVEPSRGPKGIPVSGREAIGLLPQWRSLVGRALQRAGVAALWGTVVTTTTRATESACMSLGRNLGARVCDMDSFWFVRDSLAAGSEAVALRLIEPKRNLSLRGRLGAALRRYYAVRQLRTLIGALARGVRA